MKKTLVFCLAIFIDVVLRAQWTPVYNDAAKMYDDADFPTAQDGFVLGHYNSGSYFILKTADAGATWTEIALPAGFYSQLAMYSAQAGYLARGGGNGELFYTNDAFATVTSHMIDASYSVMGLEIRTASSGFYLNNNGRLRSFDQYGANFTVLMDTLPNAMSISVGDSSTIYADNGTHLLKSVNGGVTWTCLTINLPDYSKMLTFINADTGYFIGNANHIYRTFDGGVTFQSVTAFSGCCIAAEGQFCAATSGWGTIKWSSDYGQNWSIETVGMGASGAPYLTSNGDCYLLNTVTGEIRKRQAPLTVPAPEKNGTVSVYPNPAQDHITLQLPDGTVNDDFRFTLFNTLGETVLESNVPQNNRIPLEGIPAGMYYFRVTSNTGLTGAGTFSKR